MIIVSAFIVTSGWAIYHTACALNGRAQQQFDSVLFQYVLLFSLTAIVVGSLVHFYLIRKMIRPLKDLTESTKRMKEGHYPPPVQGSSQDEMGQLISQFNDLVQQLKRSEQYRKDTVSDLSHEIRTPLANLNGYLSALKNGVIEGDEAIYESLYKESKRLIELVEQLEQLKEWDYRSSQPYSDKETANMPTLIQQSLEMFHWSLEKANVRLEVRADEGIVRVSPGSIEQVISNLLDNAIRYYEGEGSVVIQGKQLNTVYEFTITGPGKAIPKDAQPYIFDRLYRVDPSRTKDETGGTGLGLAISQEIIEHHKGTIGLTSTGNLHTFWFTLPMK